MSVSYRLKIKEFLFNCKYTKFKIPFGTIFRDDGQTSKIVLDEYAELLVVARQVHVSRELYARQLGDVQQGLRVLSSAEGKVVPPLLS